MNFPDTCPNCGSQPDKPNPKEGRRFYWCGSWIREGETQLVRQSSQCDDRRTIRDAAAIIREMVDEWGNAMDAPLLVRAEEWLKDNAP
jgi:hypothetical protein